MGLTANLHDQIEPDVVTNLEHHAATLQTLHARRLHCHRVITRDQVGDGEKPFSVGYSGLSDTGICIADDYGGIRYKRTTGIFDLAADNGSASLAIEGSGR